MARTTENNKSVSLSMRITKAQKTLLDDYCKAKGVTISEFLLRPALQRIFEDSIMSFDKPKA